MSIEKLDSLILAHLDSLPFDEQYIYKRKSGTNNKGDVKQKEIDKVKKKMEKLTQAIHLYATYNDALKSE